MFNRYKTEIVFTPKSTTEISKPTNTRTFKPLRLLLPVLLTAVAGLLFIKVKAFSLTCLDQALSLRPDFRLARLCSKFSSVPSSVTFFHDLELLLSIIDFQIPLTRDSLSRLQSSLGRLNESVSNFDGQLTLLPNATPLKQKIAGLRPVIRQLVRLSPQLPQLLGVNSSASYLVLVQDSTELRSSGGYLDTLAYITVSNARIISSPYFSPATPSKQIRDANTSPDFPTAAKEISRLFTRSTSLPVDYVIAVNLTTLSTLQKKSVSTYLDELSQTGSNNLYFSDLVSALTTQINTDTAYFL